MRLLLTFLALAISAFAQPITQLGSDADVVAFARVDRILKQGTRTTPIELQLTVERVIKGDPPRTVTAWIDTTVRRQLPIPTELPADIVGKQGLWFWVAPNPSTAAILPVDRNWTRPTGLFLEVSDSPQPSANSLDRILVGYFVRWFEALPTPSMLQEALFLNAFERREFSSPGLAFDAVAPLFKSPSIDKRRTAYVASLRAGDARAISRLMDDWPEISKALRLGDVFIAIGGYDFHKDSSWIEPLQRFVAKYGADPGVEPWSIGALIHVKTKPIVPILAKFLDTRDPQSQDLLVRFFGLYSMGALPNSEGRNSPGFLSADEAQSHMVRKDSPLTSADLIPYWKAWWERNRERIEAEAAAAR